LSRRTITVPLRFKDGVFYGWIIVAVFLVIQAVLMGIASSFTVFFKSIEAEFELTRTVTSAISSVSMILIPVSGFIGGWALDRYGPRIVLFVMGLITGLSLVLTSRTGAAWQWELPVRVKDWGLSRWHLYPPSLYPGLTGKPPISF
jgi:MFS family permease